MILKYVLGDRTIHIKHFDAKEAFNLGLMESTPSHENDGLLYSAFCMANSSENEAYKEVKLFLAMTTWTKQLISLYFVLVGSFIESAMRFCGKPTLSRSRIQVPSPILWVADLQLRSVKSKGFTLEWKWRCTLGPKSFTMLINLGNKRQHSRT